MSTRVRAGAITLAVGVSMAAMVWVSYRTIAEWQQSARQLAEQRAEATVDLFLTVLSRNMRGVQTSLLAQSGRHDSPVPLELIAGALASYSYPEAFFQWRSSSASSPVVFYARSERHPSWLPAQGASPTFPVVARTERATGRRLLDRIGRDVAVGRDYSIFDMEVGNRPHQVVARLSYEDPFHDKLDAVFGFVVDLAWTRERYIPELTREVMQMRRAAEHAQDVVARPESLQATAQPDAPGAAGRRGFQLLFFDPRLVAADWPADLGGEMWVARASAAGDPGFLRARTAARRTTIAVSLSLLGLAVGVVLTALAGRRNAQLTALRSEFVSSVTHDLKTPIATIRAISEIFSLGRAVTPEISRKHGRLALQEAKRLTRLIDNLLTYARINDVTEVYAFEPLGMDTLVGEVLHDFSSQLELLEFDVHVDIPGDLPPVRADHKAMSLALGNIIDNAIRYSPETRSLRIAARRSGQSIVVEIADRGIGISDDEIGYVTKRFFRGRRGDLAGSGLGLAIVERVVKDHHGKLDFRSAVGAGTTVVLALRVAHP